MRFLDVTLDTYQDTSRYMYLGLFITIHQDTPRYINHDTCILDASWRHFKIQSGYIKDTCGIHAGYMRDTCGILVQDTYWDSCISNVSWEVRIWEAGYMRDTCEIHVSARVIKIHTWYIRDTWWDTCQDTCISNSSPRASKDQARPQVGLEIHILECIPMYPTCIVNVSCVSCIWGLRYTVS